MICTWTWIWLAVDGPGGGTQDVSTGKWTGKEIQRRVFFSNLERVMKPVLWKRGDCVAWRRLQQDVSISKWTGKESQQRLSFNHVHVMKPVLVQKRRRCSASQVADF